MTKENTIIAQAVPTDPLLPRQWHLGTGTWSINVRDVWKDYTGEGVTVGVIDDGFDYTHPDFDNYDTFKDYDFLNNDADARDSSFSNRHGTATMGLIGADDDGEGAVGVAFDATLLGFRVGFGSSPLSHFRDALNTAAADTDVVNNSWSFTSSLADNFKNPVLFGLRDALENLANGRDGLGTVTVFSAGNSRVEGSSANYHNIQNSPYTIAVAAMDEDGTYSWFSSPGANLLVTAPGTNLYTTDKTGAGGYSGTDYYSSFGGTSGSAPLVSGVTALMLEANPDLGYRDAQEILAYSARQNDPSNAGWQYNGAGNWNGGGLHFSHDYGFGLVDAHAAVRLAETWTLQQTTANMASVTASSAPLLPLPDLSTRSAVLAVAGDIEIEHVLIDLNISHGRAGDLLITLTSPSGTESVLADRIDNGGYTGGFNFEFSSIAHWGESSAGAWTLTIQDLSGGNSGTLTGVGLTFLGNTHSTDDLYIFTNDFASLSGAELAGRTTIEDTNGGTDTLNLSALTTNSTVDFRGNETTIIAGQTMTIGADADIEVIIGGDGNDRFLTYNIAETVHGGRGNDYIYTRNGDDTLYGGDGSDSLYGGNGNDILYGEADRDYLRGNNGDDTLFGGEGNDDLRGYNDNDILYGGNGNDRLTGGNGNDTLFAGAGADRMQGDDGADEFVLYGAETLDGLLNRIVDFSVAEGDSLRLTDLLFGYNPLQDAIDDFITLVETAHTYLKIDADGTDANYESEFAVRIEYVSNQWTDASDMIAQGHLIVEQTV